MMFNSVSLVLGYFEVVKWIVVIDCGDLLIGMSMCLVMLWFIWVWVKNLFVVLCCGCLVVVLCYVG